MLAAGDCIGGRYVLEREVGEGAMGAVWKARHATLDRPFAIKFLKPFACHGQQRFVREARLAASIQNRFVVSTVDYGITDQGTPYIVMEYLEGEALGERLLRRPPLSVRALVGMAAQVLTGLQAVHDAGVVHRDLKPLNVLLVRDGDDLVPKLVDFGISRPEGATSANGKITVLTMPGMAIGTPAYMSPEQARGASNIDRRSDLYSLAVLVYEAVTGVLPYDDEDVSALLNRIERGGAPPLREARSAVGTALSDVIAKAMQVDPDARYASAREMALALERANRTVPHGLVCPGRFGAGDDWRSSDVARPTTGRGGPTGRRDASITLVDGWFSRRARELRTIARTSPRAWAAVSISLVVGALGFAWYGRPNDTPTAAPPLAAATPAPPAPRPELPPAPEPAAPDVAKAPRAASPRPAARTTPPDLYRDPGF